MIYHYVADQNSNVVALFANELPDGFDMSQSYSEDFKLGKVEVASELDMTKRYVVKAKKLAIAKTDDISRPNVPPVEHFQHVLKRNELLTKCDWTMVADVPLSDELRQAWKEYRQALRDITDQPDFPNTVVWPEPPK